MNITGSPQKLLWQYQTAIAKAGAGTVLAYIVVTTALYSAADILMVEDGVYFLISIVGWALGYLLLRYLMRASAAPGEAPLSGFFGYFALGLVSGVVIIAGLILLIIPGLYLILRWLPAYARLYVHGNGVVPALRWSWQETRALQKPLALALIWPLLFLALSLLGFFAVEIGWIASGESASQAVSSSDIVLVVVNLLSGVSAAWTQVLGIAVYRMIERGEPDLIDTFS